MTNTTPQKTKHHDKDSFTHVARSYSNYIHLCKIYANICKFIATKESIRNDVTEVTLCGKTPYYIKSYVVNFRTQTSSSQSEERTMVFTREKNDTSNQNRERCFFTCEKNDTSNQKPQRGVSFAPKFPPFIAACSAAHIQREKFYSKSSSR